MRNNLSHFEQDGALNLLVVSGEYEEDPSYGCFINWMF